MVTLLLLSLIIGVLAGLRTMIAPAAIAWAVHFGWLDVQGSWLAFFGFSYIPGLLTVLALAELVADQLPATPSRKTPVQLIARVGSGAMCGAAIGMQAGLARGGFVLGALGAVLGTFGGYEVRRRLASMFHKDRPAAFIEDASAIGGAALVVAALT